ncbi:hypothetical protein, partial [Gluconacetobacter dulcium]|uniref:hypothetical protein n=1 Tax=Gluconacetobacter dulcium TaxID=2729096 RepID=UPI001C804A79
QRPKQSNSKAIKTHKSKKYASQRPKQASIKPRLNPDQPIPNQPTSAGRQNAANISLPFHILLSKTSANHPLNPAGPRKLAGPNRQVKNLSPGGEERSTPHPQNRQQATFTQSHKKFVHAHQNPSQGAENRGFSRLKKWRR